MRFGVLGPLLVDNGTDLVAVPAARQRAVLAVLVLHAGEVVSADSLVELVWDGSPPSRAAATLRTHVMRLRRVLGPAAGSRIVTHCPGYLLEAGEDEVDLLRFQSRYRDGGAAVRGGDWDRAWTVLAEGLRLWRAAPLADVGVDLLRREEVPRLERLRLQAVEWRIEAGLHRGDHAELIVELQDLVERHPLRERFAGQLMTALTVAGRQAEALEVYQRLRRRLVDELGTDPGPELRDLHQAVLRGEVEPTAGRSAVPTIPDPVRASAPVPVPVPVPVLAAVPDRPVPAQLPADVAGFTGRVDELRRLDALLASDVPTTAAVPISVVSGLPGVGKSALVVHWAHRVADRFPDGRLYVNLRGFDPGGRVMDPIQAVRGFLDALGVPPDRIPVDLDAQAALYRSLLAGRRVLVVLDNARDADHVRPLLPAGPTAMAVVTSRTQLLPLVAAGAHPLPLGLLAHDEARQLLARRLGSDRVAAEPGAVEEIVAACDRLPLALTIAAARAQQTGFPLAALAGELEQAGELLDVLDAGDPAGQLRTVLSSSYTALTAPAARLFRLLCLHPGPDFSVPSAASLVGCPPREARRLLAELARASLLTEHRPGRYTFHDLLCIYATDLSGTEDTADQRHTAVHRLLDYYTHTAHAAERLINPNRDKPCLPLSVPAPGTSPEQFVDSHQAWDWLTGEYLVLLATVCQAAEAGFPAHCWLLAWALDTVFQWRGQWWDMAPVWQAALQAAERLSDPACQATAHWGLAHARIRLGHFAEVRTHLGHAGQLFTQAGDRVGLAQVHRMIGGMYMQQGRFDKALEYNQQALDLFHAAGHGLHAATTLNNVGWFHALMGRHTEALRHCEQALALQQELGHTEGQAHAWDSLGYAHHHLGDHREAIVCYQRAIALNHQLGRPFYEASNLCRLGDTHLAAGTPTAAREAWRQALEILQELKHPDAEQIRSRLAAPVEA